MVALHVLRGGAWSVGAAGYYTCVHVMCTVHLFLAPRTTVVRRS